MKHARFSQASAAPQSLCDMRLSERRLVLMLRLWHEGAAGQEQVWNGLCTVLGSDRARACLRAFEDVLGLLRCHGWRSLTLLPSESLRPSEDETAFARFVLRATEQDRDGACLEAAFLVRPAAMLTLVLAASRLGLPLLCEECRRRMDAHDGTTPVFQRKARHL